MFHYPKCMSTFVRKYRYHVRYDDGEEEDLTWEEIVPLLPVREASERVLKKTKSCWLREVDGKLTPWAKHPDGGKWDSVCCWPDCDGGRYFIYLYVLVFVSSLNKKHIVLQFQSSICSNLGPLLQCYYCCNSQHEECVPLSNPGTHPNVEGGWICCGCWHDFILYEPRQ